ncbi:hypothetical protein PCANC_28615 [Puccinia coronata f. sp. avenae]|uniref:DDE Tnp4 domain-containing protein n=1 Tax=Puccinia coronata f. sp. avenae TaxID=200324 RepID=A0A2N5RY35_9BASI|nr:hypothetical protein PCANC_28615 [Puccinia coronata f. sp. avenae]
MQLAQQPGQFFDQNLFLLANSSYPSNQYTIPAYKGADLLILENVDFNHHLAQSRVRIEHAIGILNGQFASLHLKDQWNKLYTASKAGSDGRIRWPRCLATKFESVDNLLGGTAPEFKSDGPLQLLPSIHRLASRGSGTSSLPPPPPCCPRSPPAALAHHLLPLLTTCCPRSPPAHHRLLPSLATCPAALSSPPAAALACHPRLPPAAALACHLLPCPRLPPAALPSLATCCPALARHLLPCPRSPPAAALSLPPAAAALACHLLLPLLATCPAALSLPPAASLLPCCPQLATCFPALACHLLPCPCFPRACHLLLTLLATYSAALSSPPAPAALSHHLLPFPCLPTAAAALACHLLPSLATCCPCSPPAAALARHLLLLSARHLLLPSLATCCPLPSPPELPRLPAALCPSNPRPWLPASLAARQLHIHCGSLHHHRYVFKAHARGLRVHSRWPTHWDTLQSAAPEAPKLLPRNPCCSV